MTSVLQILDCLCQRMLKVNALQKYHDVVTEGRIKPNVFAVFDDENHFLDLVEARQAALFPGRVFSDLLVRRSATPVSLNTTLDKVLARFEAEKCLDFYLPFRNEPPESGSRIFFRYIQKSNKHDVFSALENLFNSFNIVLKI